MKRIAMFLILVVLFTSFAQAAARKHEFPVEHAKASPAGEKMLDVPFYMKGQEHPAVKQKFGEYKSNKKSSGFRKADQDACDQAFASAIIALQQRAMNEGGDAVIDVYSITKDVKFESATKYTCVAGNTVVHVALMGTVVKLK